MCFIFTQESLPSDTLLVLSPVELEGSSNLGMHSWQLTYVNSVNPSSNQTEIPFAFGRTGGFKESAFSFGRTSFVMPGSSQTPPTRNKKNQTKRERTLMCVPIPNKMGMREEDFILCSIDPNDTQSIRSNASRAFKPYHKSASNGFGSSVVGFGFGSGADPLTVQQVGAYKICVAPNFQDFKTRIPWSEFNVEDSYRNIILNGMQKAYSDGFAFVIASSDSNVIKDSGFSIVYCNDVAYIPTAHEITAQDGQGLVEMDATVIAFNTIIDASSICTEEQNNPPGTSGTELSVYPTYRCDDSHCRSIPRRWSDCVDILAALPCVGTGTFHQHTLIQHARPICCVSWKLKGKMRNGDIYGRIASVTDKNVFMDAFAQLDYWWVARSKGFVTRLGGRALTNGRSDLSDWGGRVIDFILALVGRKVSNPSILDRFSDPDPNADVLSEIFINLDFAAERGVANTVDIDVVNFMTRKNQFLHMQDGSSAENSIYFRLSATELPPHFRTTQSRTTLGTRGWKRDPSFTSNGINTSHGGFLF